MTGSGSIRQGDQRVGGRNEDVQLGVVVPPVPMVRVAQIVNGVDQRLAGLVQGPDQVAQVRDVLGVEAELDVEDIEVTAVLPDPRRGQHGGGPPLPADRDGPGWDGIG
jgi:hypothetical protein